VSLKRPTCFSMCTSTYRPIPSRHVCASCCTEWCSKPVKEPWSY
jgi:hypothetical protein